MRFLISLFLLFEQVSPTPTPAPTATPIPSTGNSISYWAGIANILALFVALISLAVVLAPWIRAIRAKRSVKNRYTKEEFRDAFRYFVPPYCQEIDSPAGRATDQANGARYLFETLDETLNHPENYRYLILLADTGMGKTTALLNYFLHHKRRFIRRDFDLELIPLNLPHAETLIAAVENKPNTVLMLDALDENEMAIVDHADCLKLLLRITSEFRCVLISCRTQFFATDKEIPEETGVSKKGARRAGQEPDYRFRRIYLLPFNDEQINKYLRLRYPFWRWRRERQKVEAIIKQIPNLSVRPMLLTYTDDLIHAKEEIHCSFDLYDQMVKAWLVREAFITDPTSLRNFSELLAVELHNNSVSRKCEHVSEAELMRLCDEWEFKIENWELRGRSLLTRDAEGNIKFADRSILDYLFVSRFFQGDSETLDAPWTEQMHLFHWEKVVKNWERGNPWFMDVPSKLLLEHPNGIGTLITSHLVAYQKNNVHYDREAWDTFGVSLIAYMIQTTSPRTLVHLKRISRTSPVQLRGEKILTLSFSSGAQASYSNGGLIHGWVGGHSQPVHDYRGEPSEIEYPEGKVVQEFPTWIANCFFEFQPHWINRALRIKTDSGADIILAFQTTVPLDDNLVEKIKRSSRTIF